MIVLPAIDLRRGRVVRLRQGRADAETVYAEDPIAVARRWVDEGASWLHVVDLDGALSASENLDPAGVVLRHCDAGAAQRADPALFGSRRGTLPLGLQSLQALCAAFPAIAVQFGGGLRSLAAIAQALEAGVARVVLGTVAVRRPAVLQEAVARFGPARIAVAIDVRAGRVATHGWRHDAPMTAVALGRAAAEQGVQYAVYTDVQRDGMLCGIHAAAAAGLARRCGLRVIASGGVATLDDVRRLRRYEADGVVGVVVGQALYTGALSLAEAVRVAGAEQEGTQIYTDRRRLESS
jgi:phosphoribosylformimino-5-aminoimidazole carboxamide ribotide isomerase